MNIIRGINPENANQARVFFGYPSAYIAGERRHAQVIMRELVVEKGFRVLECTPQATHDGWVYWIEFELAPTLPNFFFDVPWKPIATSNTGFENRRG